MDVPTNGEVIAWAVLAVSTAAGAVRFFIRECLEAERREKERREKERRNADL